MVKNIIIGSALILGSTLYAQSSEWVFPDFSTLNSCKSTSYENMKSSTNLNTDDAYIRNWFEKASMAQIQGNESLIKELLRQRTIYKVTNELVKLKSQYRDKHCRDMVDNVGQHFANWQENLKNL